MGCMFCLNTPLFLLGAAGHLVFDVARKHRMWRKAGNGYVIDGCFRRQHATWHALRWFCGLLFTMCGTCQGQMVVKYSSGSLIA